MQQHIETNIDENKIMGSFNHMIYKIILLFMVANLTIGICLYYIHATVQKETFLAEVIKKTSAIGDNIEALLDKTITAGIPIQEIVGAREYLNEKLLEAKELEYIVVTNLRGEVIAKSDSTPEHLTGTFMQFANQADPTVKRPEPFNLFSYFNIPINIAIDNDTGRQEGFIHLGISNRSIQDNVNTIFLDIAIILFVSLVIGFEFLRFTFANYVKLPVRDFLYAINRLATGDLSKLSTIRDTTDLYKSLEILNEVTLNLTQRAQKAIAQLNVMDKSSYLYDITKDKISELKVKIKTVANAAPHFDNLIPAIENIRIIVFLTMLAEGIIFPNIPGYASQFYNENFIISKQMLATLPVLVNMTFILFAIPIGVFLLGRIGLRRTILYSTPLTVLGYVLLLIPYEGISLILFARIINAIGFGLFFVGSQSYLGTYSAPENRVKSFSIFYIALGAANIVGIPVGGILVDNLGYTYTFLATAIIALVSMVYVYIYIIDYEGYHEESSARFIINPLRLFTIPDICRSIVLLLCPVRMVHVAFLYVLFPLYVISIGSTYSTLGRIMMIFGVLMFSMSTVVHRIVKFFKRPDLLALTLAMGVSLSMFILFLWPTLTGATFAMIVYSLVSPIHQSSMIASVEKLLPHLKNKMSRNDILGLFFTYERIAMICGPLIVGISLTYVDYRTSLLVLGGVVMMSCLAYLVLTQINQKNDQGE